MGKIKHVLLLMVLIILYQNSAAQEMDEFGFAPWTEPRVSANGIFSRNAWAGGLNNIQFGKIDLDNDGVQDLLVFDRHGDRLLPFIYKTSGLSPGFNYAPEYRRYFPQINHWFQTLDYNRDGYPDIFTYTPGGIMVYRNRGEAFPSFEKAVDPYITSLQGSIYTNLLVTYVDYPAFVDIDEDGDTDILTFWGLGSFVELHQNMSVELYGNPDSLIFHKINNCWGRFAEDSESNAITFDTCVDFTTTKIASPPKHTGSTFLLTDITGNGYYDLVLGDVDFNAVIALRNEGNNIEAAMVEQLPEWPVNEPVKLWSFPLVQKIDLYNDGTLQFLASPFDPGLTRSEGQQSVWLYSECKSGNGISDCGLLTRSFLQDGMIDLGLGAYPVFYDVNSDNLLDMVIGNYGLYDTCFVNENGQLKCYYTGRLHLYLNSGTSDLPSFNLADDDFGNISQLGLTGVYPAFYDLDNDGDMDMLVGNSEGDLWFLRNSAGQGQIPFFETPWPGYQSLKVVGFSTPTFIDLNKDGLIDLVVGSVDGKLSYYENTGITGEPIFTLKSDNLGGVNVTDPNVSYTGYSVPCFFSAPDGELRLLAGSESGYLKYYKNITSATGQNFELADAHFMYISEGIRTAPAIADLNNDGFPDLAIGNYSGGITLFKGTPPGPADIIGVDVRVGKLKVTPNPGNGWMRIHIDLPGKWQLNMFNMEGLLIKTTPAEGLIGNDLYIAGSYSGVIIIEARNIENPWLVLRSKAVIIR